jgi:hypothetical protein
MRRASGGSAELDARPLSGGRGSGPAEVVTGSEAPEAAEILAAEPALRLLDPREAWIGRLLVVGGRLGNAAEGGFALRDQGLQLAVAAASARLVHVSSEAVFRSRPGDPGS